MSREPRLSVAAPLFNEERLIQGKSPTGFTALIVAVALLSGVQLLVLGIIGEYLGRVYEESKGRPQYAIGRIVPAKKPE